jgi:glc operon protein GlcG
MRILGAILVGFIATLMLATSVVAQTTPAPVPDKMPFDIPYGTPINLETAKKAADAAFAEAKRRGWKMAITVVSPSGMLTYFEKMDDTQFISVEVSQRKAKSAAMGRRETEEYYKLMESGHPYVATLDPDVLTASPGGIPIIVDGKLIGAIGCSGGAGSQDAVVCKAGAAAVSR